LAHRPAAEFFAKRLLEHFVYRNPSAAAITTVANLLRASGWELAPVLKTLFTSEAFYSAKAKTALVRNPVQEAVAFSRSTGLVPMDKLEDWDAPDGSPNTPRPSTRLYQAAQLSPAAVRGRLAAGLRARGCPRRTCSIARTRSRVHLRLDEQTVAGVGVRRWSRRRRRHGRGGCS
jgi:uncharacterized protein (DUF1800 family)